MQHIENTVILTKNLSSPLFPGKFFFLNEVHINICAPVHSIYQQPYEYPSSERPLTNSFFFAHFTSDVVQECNNEKSLIFGDRSFS